MEFQRRYPIGAEVLQRGVHFRIWAPLLSTLHLVLETKEKIEFKKEEDGYFSCFAPHAKAGMCYHFCVNEMLVPDPTSRFQPKGPKGPSCIIDPFTYSWRDQKFQGIGPISEQIIYELHIGTFTKEGTWQAAIEKLSELKDLGVTILEIMPIAEFSGSFGWGYDGVDMFAPTRIYGHPDDVRAFVDEAHLLGMSVILDVVYNHLGAIGNFLHLYTDCFHTDAHKTEWGKPINFYDKGAKHVREFYVTNASYWIEEFHFDGLRLDATQNIYDISDPHILVEIANAARAKALDKQIFIIAENESQNNRLALPQDKGGYGLNALWNDDFHHAVKVRLTGRKEAYYHDYKGSCQELLSTIKYGYLYQGQYYAWQKQRRGTPSLQLPLDKYVIYLQNHDQVANSLAGQRIHDLSDPAILRMMTLLLLLSPSIPLLFQGQEFGSSSPFYFFADYDEELNLSLSVIDGRRDFLFQFLSIQTSWKSSYKNPLEKETFLLSKIDWQEKQNKKNQKIYALHKDLIALRKQDTTFTTSEYVDGAVLTSDVFLIRYFGLRDRLILFNFGIDFSLSSIPEPLFAIHPTKKWELMLSTEDPKYGGQGTPSFKENEGKWVLPGHSALVFKGE